MFQPLYHCLLLAQTCNTFPFEPPVIWTPAEQMYVCQQQSPLSVSFGSGSLFPLCNLHCIVSIAVMKAQESMTPSASSSLGKAMYVMVACSLRLWHTKQKCLRLERVSTRFFQRCHPWAPLIRLWRPKIKAVYIYFCFWSATAHTLVDW